LRVFAIGQSANACRDSGIDVVEPAVRRTGVAAIENEREARPAGGHFLDQRRHILVDQIVASGLSAVVAHDGLVPAVGLDGEKQAAGGFLGAVTGIEEDGDVAGFRLAEMLAKTADDGIARGVAIEETQHLIGRNVIPLQENAAESAGVVDTSLQAPNVGGIVIDANDERVEIRHGA
jgi:hypothetical protein